MTKKIKNKKPNSPKKKIIKAKVPKLNPKHKLFVEEYLITLNAKRSYMAVYRVTNERSAEVMGEQLLRKLEVQEYLKEKFEERSKMLKIDALAVMEKNMQILDADYTLAQEYIQDGQLEKLPDHLKRLVQGVEVTKTTNRTTSRNGLEIEIETEKSKIKFMSKDKAKEELAKQLGAFSKDNERILTHNMKGFVDGLKELDI